MFLMFLIALKTLKTLIPRKACVFNVLIKPFRGINVFNVFNSKITKSRILEALCF